MNEIMKREDERHAAEVTLLRTRHSEELQLCHSRYSEWKALALINVEHAAKATDVAVSTQTIPIPPARG